ncbi:molybdopterin-guanine dinucleotide biosynthesis protein B [Bacillus sp. AFS037270]|uniref:molybdopterin-guanine dinucleotide biosynthesis protein B n=1 Tax=Bacillus sp. AFS037270 TaxID=2033499 RepID=UPI000BFDBB20|nr:molybdopterin-guanine dinucleotide biosynthesis protein B [Bacillus sp. AFS037270]PGV48001.1 molybdopterin-guanine dinucleotide biosynthesis protein B [Bacillus sp. AFS037270]
MALVEPFIFQVVGYQNSGKTTIITKLIKSLTDQGIKTVTIKHHGHGGKPDVMEEKDSSRHLSSGAIAAIVEGGGRMILQADKLNLSLEDEIELLKFYQPDVVLVEGYKQKNYPKLLLLKKKEDLHLLNSITNICTVGYWSDELINEYMQPSFSIKDEVLINWTTELILGHVHKNDEKS